MTALALRAPARRGRHRLTLKRRLIRWNERTTRELGRTQPRRRARGSAFRLSFLSTVPAYSGDAHYFPAFLTACAFFLAGLILLVVFW